MEVKRFSIWLLVLMVVLSDPGCKSNSTNGGKTEQAVATPMDLLRYGTSSPNDQGDIKIGEPLQGSPRLVMPVESREGISDGPDGFPLFDQFFSFNPATKESGLVSGWDLPGGMNMQGSYGNTVIDSQRLKSRKRLRLGPVIVTTDRSKCAYTHGCATIGISFEEHPKVRISADYVVSSSDTNTASQAPPNGYFAVIFFDQRYGKYDPKFGKEVVTGALSISRKGSQPVQINLGSAALSGDAGFDSTALASLGVPVVEISNIHRKTDVIQWSLMQGGKITRQGSFGFPVVGTTPRLVYYSVRLDEQGEYLKSN